MTNQSWENPEIVERYRENKMSLKSRIENFYRNNYPRIIHKGEILKLSVRAGYESENAGRRCRELVDEGKLKAIYQKGQVSYQWIPPGQKMKSVLPPAYPPKQNVVKQMSLI